MTSNFTRVEGNSIIFKTVPAVGVLSLTGFTDDAGSADTSGNSMFIKSFRYSLNGIDYSEWIPLTVANLQTIDVNDKELFIAEISYFKQQPLGEDYLSISTINLTTESGEDSYTKTYFQNSLFSKYFTVNDADVLNWYINVLEKLYDKGLVPNFIQRKDEDGSIEDYIAFFGAVAKFFAFYVNYARVFSHFYDYQDLITEFIEQRGLNASPIELSDLQHLLETYYYQIHERGAERSVDFINPQEDKEPESYRLIRKEEDDVYIFNHYKKQHSVWNVNNSSPLFRGLPPSYVYKNLDADLYGVTFDGTTYHINENSLTTKKVQIDASLDYSFTCLVKTTTGKLDIYVHTYDENGMPVDGKLRRNGDLLTDDRFLQAGILSRSDKYILVRVFVYNYKRPFYVKDALNIKQGNNIVLRNVAKQISFTITSDGIIDVQDLKLFPAYTNYSRGFINVNNFISIWLKNRNYNYNLLQLRDYIAKYLVPYNTAIKITNIGDFFYTEAVKEIDEFEWIGAGDYCRKAVWIGADPSCIVENLIWVAEEETAVCEQIQY